MTPGTLWRVDYRSPTDREWHQYAVEGTERLALKALWVMMGLRVVGTGRVVAPDGKVQWVAPCRVHPVVPA